MVCLANATHAQKRAGYQAVHMAYSGLVAAAKNSPTDSSLGGKIIEFAKTLIGVPYRYACMTPALGFDCSGFVNYVFDHFRIKVPRSSVDFTHQGTYVSLNDCGPGDLILFRGTNPRTKVVGHMGIVTRNDDGCVSFIHSTSGAAYAVIVSKLEENYMKRFVKVIRLAK